MKAHEIGKERFYSHADLGPLYLKRGQRDKGLKMLEEGISLSCYRCYIALGYHYLQEGHYFEACQSLIQPLKKTCFNQANDLFEEIIDQHPTIEIGKLLIENGLSQGIVCLLKCDIKTEQIIEILKDKYLFTETCEICCETKEELKFLCGHHSCIDCLRKINQRKNDALIDPSKKIQFRCAFCRQTITSFIKNKRDLS